MARVQRGTLVLLIVPLGAGCLSACNGGAFRGSQEMERPDIMTPLDVTPPQAKDLIVSKGYRYLDVRTVAEYEAGHPSAAFNVPIHEPDASGSMAENPDFLRVVEATFPKDAPIIVGCRSGGRSQTAAEVLRQAGFTRVVNMLGGYGGGKSASGAEVRGWVERGYPIDQDQGGARSYAELKAKGR